LEVVVAANFNRDQIRAALGEKDPAHSFYLDLETGEVVKVPDAEQTAEAEAIRNKVMEGYGERYRYIPGGNDSPTDADVQSWMDAEGI
jgi:predicted exporter